jgi:hypothetical protein
VGIAVEITLVILETLTHLPVSAFDYSAIVIQILRICIFILLPALYFGLRNDRKQYENSDAERQSLLRKKLAPKPSGSEDSTLNGNESSNGNGHGHGYGTTDTTAEDSDSDSDADPDEDRYIKSEREAKKLIQKRLKQDGNWFTYAKGFTVSRRQIAEIPASMLTFIQDLLPIYLALARQKSATSNCICGDVFAFYKCSECLGP